VNPVFREFTRDGRYHLGNLGTLLRTPIGRKQLLFTLNRYSWPVLRRVARLYRRTLGRNTRIIAVVGSFGKTTTARAVFAALGGGVEPRFHRNCWSSVARSVLRSTRGHAVIEVGIDNTGQMAAYADTIRPDITVVTSIGSEHRTSLRSMEVTRAEKCKMVEALSPSGTAILNGDDPNVLWMKGRAPGRVVTFGLGESNDIRADDVMLDWPLGTTFRLHANAETHQGSVRLIGRHMVYPALAAVAVALTEGFLLDRVMPAVASLTPTPGRMQPVRLRNGAFVLRDDSKSAMETMEAAFDAFSEVPARRRIAVLGEITERSRGVGPTYRHIGRRIGRIASLVVFVGSRRACQALRVGAVQAGLPRPALIHAGRSVLTAAEALPPDLGAGDVILTKGQRRQRLERLALALAGRKVRCDLTLCTASVTLCERCVMLERGWAGQKVIQ